MATKIKRVPRNYCHIVRTHDHDADGCTCNCHATAPNKKALLKNFKKFKKGKKGRVKEKPIVAHPDYKHWCENCELPE